MRVDLIDVCPQCGSDDFEWGINGCGRQYDLTFECNECDFVGGSSDVAAVGVNSETGGEK